VRIAFATNIWTHHQSAFCEEMVRLVGADSFRLLLTQGFHEERRELGWSPNVPKHSWVIGPPVSRADWEELARIVDEADVAVLGSCPRWMWLRRAGTGKLTFYATERYFKMPLYWWRFLNPRFLLVLRRLKRIANNPNSHYLAIGNRAASDMRTIGAFGGRTWRWAYFLGNPNQSPLERPERPMRVLWLGRMLALKRIDTLLTAVFAIRDEPGFGHVDIIGTGPEFSRLEALSRRLGLASKVSFQGPIPAKQVASVMRASDVYVLASDRHEGWGAVVNEAMAEGMVVVANEEAGVSRVLIRHQETGFLFGDGNVDALAQILRTLSRSRELRNKIGLAAATHIREHWHPRVGAERLLELSTGLLGLRAMPNYDDGPCSRC
jgi:glycosyltransferase involved in cell wall biosynthesis